MRHHLPLIIQLQSSRQLRQCLQLLICYLAQIQATPASVCQILHLEIVAQVVTIEVATVAHLAVADLDLVLLPLHKRKVIIIQTYSEELHSFESSCCEVCYQQIKPWMRPRESSTKKLLRGEVCVRLFEIKSLSITEAAILISIVKDTKERMMVR